MANHVHICMFLILVSITISSCGELEAPLSEVSFDTYIVSGPEEGSEVAEPLVTFQWEGSNSLVNEFSYRYMPYQENWSVWSSDVSITLDHLDQGDYVFEVKGRYEPGNEDDTPARRSFTVDIPGPGMLMKPFRQKTVMGEEFNIYVIADDVEDLVLAHLVLKFDPSKLQAVDANPGEIFQSYPPAFFKTIDNSGGIVDISISSIGAEPSRFSGTGAIAAIRFKSLSVGESSVDFDRESEFRDSKNKPVLVLNQFGSIVEIAGMMQ